jgi:hypothetical protein
MLGYAIMLAMKLEFGFRTFLHGQCLEHLSYFFKHIDHVESLDSLCDEENTFPWEDYLKKPDMLAEHPKLSKGHAIDYVNDVSI